MGWGCYKHEWDAGSEDWAAFMSDLCDRQLEKTPRTWGRDSAICPKCWVEREALLRELRTKIGRIGAAMYVSFNIAVAGACDDLVASIDAELGETPTTGEGES